MIPTIFLAPFSIAIVVSIARGISEVSVSSRWIGTGATLFGILMVWDRTKNRYAFTHDLGRSLNSKRVNLAISVFVAGIILLIVSSLSTRLDLRLG